MESLKKYSEKLAPRLGLTHAALYERQRQLVRLKLLKVSETTGPGGGVRATPHNVAMLLIAVLVTDNLSELSLRAPAAAHLRSETGRCPLTQAPRFHAALNRILSDRTIAVRVWSINFYRSAAGAWIQFIDQDIGSEGAERKSVQNSEFGFRPEKFDLVVTALITGDLFAEIAADLEET
jgi:hypothetical protein